MGHWRPAVAAWLVHPTGPCPQACSRKLYEGQTRMAKDTPAANSPIKYFVLDTNVLLHNPNALFAFADNTVIIPFDVLEELDKFKKDSTDVGRSARTAIR